MVEAAAQVVIQLLSQSEIGGLNLVLNNNFYLPRYCQLPCKDENKEERDREWPIIKRHRVNAFVTTWTAGIDTLAVQRLL